MKTTLKIFGLVCIVAMIFTSCEAPYVPDDQPKHPDPIDWTKLHHLRPTKPIRIPDTMAIQTMKPSIYHAPLDSVKEQGIGNKE